jgi:predicted RNA-binding Zn ribbon-like protein
MVARSCIISLMLSEQRGMPVPPAPLAIRFANTRYGVRSTVREGLATPQKLEEWLRANAQSLADAGAPMADQASVSAADLARFVSLRDSIASLARAVAHSGPLDLTQVAQVNETAALVPSWPELLVGKDGITVVHRSGHTGGLPALSAIARDAVQLLGGPDRDAIRACQAPGCVQLFIKDGARRVWCSAACGNRARVARHHERHRDR